METAKRKFLTFLIALGAIGFAVVSPASANGVLFLAGPKPVASYVGPGDITNTFVDWHSCAFVYKASLAGSSTNMCDLVVTGTTTPVVCTLRGSPSGSVDLSLCADGVTAPATACASGCSVSQAYDQTGHGVPLLGNGAANTYLRLVFSALGGKPCMTEGTGGSNLASTAGVGTISVPGSGSVVASMTSGGADIGIPGMQNSYGIIYVSAGSWGLYGGSAVVPFAANDATFHAVQILLNGTSSAGYVDGTSTGALGTDPGSFLIIGRGWRCSIEAVRQSARSARPDGRPATRPRTSARSIPISILGTASDAISDIAQTRAQRTRSRAWSGGAASLA